MSGSLLMRYEAGAYAQVWDELVAYGAAVREEPLLSEALAVARETMRRVRANLQLLLQRLDAAGYVFGNDFGDHLFGSWESPPADALDRIDALERLVGPVPLSIRAFYETIGAVNLLGYHPTLDGRGDSYSPKRGRRAADPPGSAAPDPLVIVPLDWLIAECREHLDDPERTTPLTLWLSPDRAFKAGFSGGEVYGVIVPDAAADAPLQQEWHATSFVNYLRLCMCWGGFPGLGRDARPPREFLHRLTAGLLPM